MHRIRKFMPLFVVAILAAVIILPMWAGNTETSSSNAAEIKTLEELKAAFATGGEYKLAADIVSDTYIEGFKDITLDLNGHKLSRTNIVGHEKGDKDRYFINFRDGTFTINNSASTIGEIYASEKDGAIASPRVVAANALDPDEAYPNGYHPVVIVNKNVKLKVKGSAIRNVDGYTGVTCLGSWTNYAKSSDQIVSTAQAIVNEGAILDASECPTDDTGRNYTVLVEGYGADLQINGGKFIAGRRFLSVDEGATATIANGTFTAENRGIWCGGNLVINGGTFTAPTDKKLLNAGWDLDSAPAAYTRGKITINGGTFTGKMSEDKDAYGNYQGYIEIYNGTFYNDPTEFTVGSANVTYADGKWTVENSVKKVASFDGTADGLKLLEKGGTFQVNGDIVIPKNESAIKTKKDVTLDLNGHKISKQSSYLRTDDTSAKSIFRVQDGTFTLNNSASTEGEIYGETVENEFATVRGVQVGPTWSDYNGGTKEGATGSHPKAIINSGVKITVTGSPSNETGDGSGMSRGIGIFTDDTPNTKDTIKCTATVEVNGATIESGSNAITTDGHGTYLTVNGGTYKGGRHGISNNRGNTKVNDATVTGGIRYALYNCIGNFKVNGGTYTAGSNEKSKAICNDVYYYYEDYKEYGDATIKVTSGIFTGGIDNKDEYEGQTAVASITLEEGTFTVDPSAYVPSTSSVTKLSDTSWLVVKTSGPTTPIIEGDVPENVDTKADTEPASVEEVPVVFADSVVVAEDGMAYIKTEDAKTFVAKAFTSEKFTEVKPLPIFKSEIAEAGKVAAVSVNMKGSELLKTATKIEELDIRKLTSTSEGLEYEQIFDTAKAKDGTFIVLSALGKVASGAIDADTVYQLVMFIQDNGKYDLDATAKIILDPATLVKTENSSGGSSSSGGCNAGFGAIALLFAVPAIFRKKK